MARFLIHRSGPPGPKRQALCAAHRPTTDRDAPGVCFHPAAQFNARMLPRTLGRRPPVACAGTSMTRRPITQVRPFQAPGRALAHSLSGPGGPTGKVPVRGVGRLSRHWRAARRFEVGPSRETRLPAQTAGEPELPAPASGSRTGSHPQPSGSSRRGLGAMTRRLSSAPGPWPPRRRPAARGGPSGCQRPGHKCADATAPETAPG